MYVNTNFRVLSPSLSSQQQQLQGKLPLALLAVLTLFHSVDTCCYSCKEGLFETL